MTHGRLAVCRFFGAAGGRVIIIHLNIRLSAYNTIGDQNLYILRPAGLYMDNKPNPARTCPYVTGECEYPHDCPDCSTAVSQYDTFRAAYTSMTIGEVDEGALLEAWNTAVN
jgi:hypothetical protein